MGHLGVPSPAAQAPAQGSSKEAAMGELGAMVEAWVDEGLIMREQADAILAREGLQARALKAEGLGARTPVLVAEALGYVGAALAVVAGLIVSQRFWGDLQPWARVLLPVVASAVLIAAGAFLRDRGTDPVGRLVGFLWLAGTAAEASALWLLSDELLRLAGSASTALAGAGAALLGGGLWWLRRHALQQIPVLVGIVAAVGGSMVAIDRSLETWVGAAAWAVGIVWLLLAWGRLVRPERTALALGGIAALFGPQTVAGIGGLRWPLVLGLLTAATLVAVSVRGRGLVLLGLGVAGVFIYAPQVVFEFFGEALGAPLALFVVGVLLVGVAFSLARLQRSSNLTAEETTTEQ